MNGSKITSYVSDIINFEKLVEQNILNIIIHNYMHKVDINVLC